MESKIKEIYDNLVRGTKFMDDISREVEKNVNKITKKEKQEMDMKAFEAYRDQFFLAASIGEEAGFVKGFTYAVALMAECLTGDKNPIVKP